MKMEIKNNLNIKEKSKKHYLEYFLRRRNNEKEQR